VREREGARARARERALLGAAREWGV
jgi:hypothetical protein